MVSTRPGHIERLPGGSYRVIVYAGTDPLTGRRLRFRQTVKTEEQAQILLGKLLEQVAEGRQPETGVTVAELLRQYIAVAELDQSTRQTYEGYIRRTILPVPADVCRDDPADPRHVVRRVRYGRPVGVDRSQPRCDCQGAEGQVAECRLPGP